MEIKRNRQEQNTFLSLSGRLDTMTSNELASTLSEVFEEGFENLVFDLSGLDYISSAGLRVFLSAQKKINAEGLQMKVVGSNESVKEVFEVTGFTSIIKIE